MNFDVDREINSQPECWTQAGEVFASVAARLPAPGERVAFVGCGTSWFVGQVLANWRESRGLGESDAFTASEVPTRRRYDRIVALTRSGTTTEVIELLRAVKGHVPTVAVTADLRTPVAEVADEVIDLSFADESSVVQTRFATTTLALFRAGYADDLGPLIAQAREAVAEALPTELIEVEQLTFLGAGWTTGIAHEAALKFRETSSSWAESYAAMEYRHGPIAVAGEGRGVWMFGPAPVGLADQVAATGAFYRETERDAMAELIVAQRVAVARAQGLGLNPDRPRHLTRSVILGE